MGTQQEKFSGINTRGEDTAVGEHHAHRKYPSVVSSSPGRVDNIYKMKTDGRQTSPCAVKFP